MARTTYGITVGTVLTNGDIAPLMTASPDPLTDVQSAVALVSTALVGLASNTLSGMTTTQINGLVSAQLTGLTTAYTALLEAQTLLAQNVVLTYDTSVVTTRNILRKVLEFIRRLMLGHNDLT